MRKIVYSLMVSLDGFIEDAEGGLGWSAPDEELHKHFNDLYLSGEIDTSIYGRRLYEIMAGYWPTADSNPSAPEVEKEFAAIWKKVPKLVFSKTLEKVDWNSRLLREIDAGEIKKLKNESGNNIEIGGADLAADFIRLGLIDEYHLYIHPVLLGGGKPMFPLNKEKHKLRHIKTKTFGSNVVLLQYEALHENSK